MAAKKKEVPLTAAEKKKLGKGKGKDQVLKAPLSEVPYVPHEFVNYYNIRHPADPADPECSTYVNRHRNTCIRVSVDRKWTRYIPMDAAGLAVRKMTHAEFKEEWVLCLANYTPESTADWYLGSYAAKHSISQEARTFLLSICSPYMRKSFTQPQGAIEMDILTAIQQRDAAKKTAVQPTTTKEQKMTTTKKAATTTKPVAAKATTKAAPAAKAAKPAATKAKATKPAAKKAAPAKAAPKAAAKATKPAAKPAKVAPKTASKAAKPDIYAQTVKATAQAKEARPDSFFGKLAAAAAKPITLQALITTLAKDKTIFRDKTGEEALASLKVRCRDAFTRLGYLQAAK